MSYLDVKYINLISSSLRNFKRKGGNLFNFSCPFCGDSQKSQRKARGYVYNAGDKMLYSCHNCGITTSVQKLIKHVNPILHDEYIKELMLEKYGPRQDKEEIFSEKLRGKPIFEFNQIKCFTGIAPVSALGESHECKVYVRKRKIPEEWHQKIYYVGHFMRWTNTLIPEKFSDKALDHDEARLIIPFKTADKKIFGYTGRSLKETLDKDNQKYYTIILDETHPKIFGLDIADLKRKHYIFEGPIDAMFIPNSIAIAGGDLYGDRDLSVLVFDNEPRNKDTCKRMQKAINRGYKVCIWPTSWEEKDINEMVLNNMAPSFIKQMIDERTHQGMAAQLVFDAWRKT